MSEDTGSFLHCPNKYSKSLSWAENLNKFFIDLGGKFKFSAQDSDLEYLFWQCKNPSVSLGSYCLIYILCPYGLVLRKKATALIINMYFHDTTVKYMAANWQFIFQLLGLRASPIPPQLHFKFSETRG